MARWDCTRIRGRNDAELLARHLPERQVDGVCLHG